MSLIPIKCTACLHIRRPGKEYSCSVMRRKHRGISLSRHSKVETHTRRNMPELCEKPSKKSLSERRRPERQSGYMDVFMTSHAAHESTTAARP